MLYPQSNQFRQVVDLSGFWDFRFDGDDGVWRIAFIFDPQRNAILLVGGDKSGVKEKRFYQQLINKADSRYQEHLENRSE